MRPTPSTVRGALLALAVTSLTPLLHGCAGGGGSDGGAAGAVTTSVGTSTGTSTGNGVGPTAASIAHTNAALAALGNASPIRGALTIDAAPLATWNNLLAESWPTARRIVDEQVEKLLRQQAAALSQGTIQILAINNLVIDTAAPPSVYGANNGPTQQLGVSVPSAPGAWRLAATLEIGTVQTLNVLGVSIPITVSFDVSVDVSNIRISDSGTLDVTNPARPTVQGTAVPQATIQLALSSNSPLLSQVLPVLTGILDPIIRVAIVGGGYYAQREIANLIPTFIPAQPWGLGAPAPAVVSPAPDLRRIAEDISTEIVRVHMPDGITVPVKFDSPTFGQGNVVATLDHVDAGDWTGRYVAAEAYRYDLTGDPRALSAARRGLDGVEACVETVANTNPALGLISRCSIPLSSPWIVDIRGKADYFEGTFRGVPYGSLDDISRDKYISIAHTAGTVWLRLPTERPRAARMAAIACDYIVQNRWNCFRADGVRLAIGTPFSQTPSVVWGQIATAYITDTARYAALHAQWKDLTGVMWLNTWASSREVFDDYFKFELSYAELANLFQIEADPSQYREYVKSLEIFDDVVGHHDNSWFDAIHGAAIPAEAAVRGARVKSGLERWTLRPRRAFSVDLKNDATITKQTVTSFVVNSNTQSAAPTPKLVALYPVPIEKRPSTDFVWQRSPFGLESWFPSEQQWIGMDLLCPYWMAASYGMVP